MIRSTGCRSCQACLRRSGQSAPGLASRSGSNPFSGSDDVNRLWARLGRGSPFVGVLIIIMILALLCAGLYAGDRYANRRAEHQAAKTLQSELGTPALPQVDIRASPF